MIYIMIYIYNDIYIWWYINNDIYVYMYKFVYIYMYINIYRYIGIYILWLYIYIYIFIMTIYKYILWLYIYILWLYLHIIDSCYVSCHNLPRGIQRTCCNKRMGYWLCLPGWDLFPQEHPRCWANEQCSKASWLMLVGGYYYTYWGFSQPLSFFGKP